MKKTGHCHSSTIGFVARYEVFKSAISLGSLPVEIFHFIGLPETDNNSNNESDADFPHGRRY